MPDGDDGSNSNGGDAEELASAYQEPDPEADLPDPETDLPNVPTPPSVDIPSPTRSGEGVPGELLAGFWTTVVVFNVALFATSLGVLLLVAGVQRRIGAGALIVGLLAAGHGYWKYRSLSERHRNGAWTEGSSSDEPPERERDGSDERNG